MFEMITFWFWIAIMVVPMALILAIGLFAAANNYLAWASKDKYEALIYHKFLVLLEADNMIFPACVLGFIEMFVTMVGLSIYDSSVIDIIDTCVRGAEYMTLVSPFILSSAAIYGIFKYGIPLCMSRYYSSKELAHDKRN